MTSGRCCPPVKMRSVVCAYAGSASAAANSVVMAILASFIVSSSRCRSPVGAADRGTGLRVEQMEPIHRERHGHRLAHAQYRIPRKASRDLASLVPSHEYDQ